MPSSKLVGYVLPALAPWCLLLSRAAQGHPRRARWAAGVSAAAGLTLVLLLANPAVLTRLHIKPQASSKSAAAAIAAQLRPGDRVVFVDQMFYDLPFYARLQAPVIVASDWDNPELPLHDNWRKELYDAARFDPALGRGLLYPIARVAELACHSQAVWFVMKPGQGTALAALPDIVPVHADSDLVVLRGSGRCG
jgi:hypothetical protein